MNRGALRRAATSWKTFIFVALLFCVGVVGTTAASFTGEAQNKTSTFAADWVAGATGLTITPSGYDVSVSWTAGSHNVSAQQLWGVSNTTTSNCTSVTYAQLATLTTSPYTDTNRGNHPAAPVSANGDWYCYAIIDTSPWSTWTTTTAAAATQVGLATTAVAFANGRTAGTLDSGDTIKLTFNQKPTAAGT